MERALQQHRRRGTNLRVGSRESPSLLMFVLSIGGWVCSTMSLRLLWASTRQHRYLACPLPMTIANQPSQLPLQGAGLSAQLSSFIPIPLLDGPHCRSSNSDTPRTKFLIQGQCSQPDGYNQTRVEASYFVARIPARGTCCVVF